MAGIGAGLLAKIRALVADEDINLNLQDGNGRTALLYASVHYGAQYSFCHRRRPYRQGCFISSTGWFFLSHALTRSPVRARYKRHTYARLQKGVPVDQRDNEGTTALPVCS